MRVGTITFATTQGIAHLARDFWRNGVVQRLLLVKHRHYVNRPDLYPPEVSYPLSQLDSFLTGLDVLLLFETDLSPDWHVSRLAKGRGIKVVLMPMYEYSPFPAPVELDLALCPSKLDLDYYKDRYKSVYIPVPVEQTWRLRERALEFVHNAGHGQWDYAKGTVQLIGAMEHVQAPIKLRIRYLPDAAKMKTLFYQHRDHPKIIWECAELPPDQLYASGDVFVNAEKLNGLSLPLQEAWASGMVVCTTDRYPANDWLPTEPLIPVERYEKCRIPGGSGIEFDKAIVSPKDVALTIDGIYGEDISRFSLAGRDYAEANSWAALKPRYAKVLEELL